MSDISAPQTSDARRDALFATWLQPLHPAHLTRAAIVDKVAPFRRHFVAAVRHGFTWNQLAHDVATKPEIGIKTSGKSLKQCVAEAFRQAGEPVPKLPRSRQHRATRVKPKTHTSAAA